MDPVRRLEATFRDIAATRMAGLPILHPRLRVQAVDFAPEAGGGLLGVLVTPWFMNLVRLPPEGAANAGSTTPIASTAPAGPAVPLPAPGHALDHTIGGWTFRFLGQHEAGCGRFAAASLVSPMGEFADQEAAVATARALLERLRPRPARRAFLFGRAEAAAAEGAGAR